MGLKQDDFECIQCGECCIRYGLDLPDGTRSKPFIPCKHLEQSSIKDSGLLSHAKCSLHQQNLKPEVCKDWPYGERQGVCYDGISVWSRMASLVGIEKLPVRVREILESRWEKIKD